MMIYKKPILITNFLRVTKNFTSSDWQVLTEKIKNKDLDLKTNN